MTPSVLAGAIAIAFVAAGCQSLTGFGFALVMVPLLSLVWDVKLAVVTSTVLSTAAVLPLLLEVRSHVQPRKVAPLLLGSFLGVPAGILLLDRIDAGPLKLLVAAVLIVASLILYLAPSLTPSGSGGVPSVMVGMLSGVLRASTSMGGPPIVLYVLTREPDVEEFRSTILAVFLPTSLLTLVGLAVTGWMTRDVLAASAVALPALAVGLLAGAWLRHRVPQGLFRTLVLAFLVLASVGVILSASGQIS
ncbi:MAG: sulfite exporter TauE/SafE family protein [Chloroflexota bacterium]|nr:sulfite exporter TauE/SafE family protein [Chloroflexota bacterium]